MSQMTVGSNSLYFTYDANGTPLTVTYNGTTYYYATNLQGDITAILNSAGTAVVTYTYDAWGNILDTDGKLSPTLGTLNPLRYRGYVYDVETGLYYLQSRYYNPEWGRFISADAYISTGQGVLGHNMFAYCLNNPIMYADPCGTFSLSVVIKKIIHIIETMITYVNLRRMGFDNISLASASDCVTAMNRSGINTAEEKAHFFAQCYVEGNLSLLEAGWLSEESAEAYRKKQPYYPYYGAGYIQLTWNYNYKKFSEYIGDPKIYEIGPKYVAEHYAWSAAGWYWSERGINEVIANGGGVKEVTRIVNGGYSQLQERTNAYNRFIVIWGG